MCDVVCVCMRESECAIAYSVLVYVCYIYSYKINLDSPFVRACVKRVLSNMRGMRCDATVTVI